MHRTRSPLRPGSLLLGLLALGLGLLPTGAARAARVKQLVEVRGFRENPLVGYGLVVGLQNTGDLINSDATRRSLAQLMRHLGVMLPAADIRARNVAMVIVTAQLPPFARSGSRVDVTVSSMGTARSLQGGTLIATPLKGADLKTYALAQGALSTGGFQFEGLSGTGMFRNQTNVGRIPGGAVIEKDAPGAMPGDKLELLVREPNFTTATRIAEAINTELGDKLARVADAGTIAIELRAEDKENVAGLIARLGALEAAPDVPARVVIDERTGTVVIGAEVTLAPAAVAFGSLTVRVTERPFVSQPGAFAGGNTVVTPQTDVQVEEREGEVKAMPAAATVGDVAAALNLLKAKPRELIPILQALKAAGALQAEIQVL